MNTGGSDAEIIECCAFILAIEEPYDLDPEIGIFVNISHPKVIKAGDSAFAIFDKSEGLSENAVITLQMQNSQQESDVRSTLKTVNTYLKGFVKYKDGNNTIRRTDFSRKYDILQRRFTYWTTDPDYESES